MNKRASLVGFGMLMAVFSSASGADSGPPPASGKAPAGTPHVYKTVDGRPLTLYIVAPPGWKSSGRNPAIVFFHGGGWFSGNPSAFNDQARYLASRGMVCILPEYRLLDKTGKEPPIVCIQDAKSAMRWVRGHAAELGIDPDRIASAGGSAGAHLAAFVGMMDGFDDPQDDLSVSPKSEAMVLFNPVIDNGPGGYAHERMGSNYIDLSPFHNVGSTAPPAVVFLGSMDRLVPVKTIKDFEAAMHEAGVRCEAFIYEGGKHGFFNQKKNDGRFYETLEQTDIFLTSLGWLKGPPTIKKPVSVAAPASPAEE